MKNFFRNNRGVAPLEITLVIIIMAVLAVLFIPHRARAQSTVAQPYQPNYPTALAAFSGIKITNGTVATFTPTNYVALHQQGGESWIVSGQLAGAGTSANAIWFDATDDGTNFTTDHPYVMTWTSNGTNTVVHWLNLTRDQANNVRALYPTVISNGTASGVLTLNFLHESHSQQ